MNEEVLAHHIANQVLRDTQFWIAIVGLMGAVVGSVIMILGNIFLHQLQNRRARKLDEARKRLLLDMLKSKDWRRLTTLARVIGANPDETKRLLIDAGARGSEKRRDDDDEAWGLLSKHPLSDIE